MATRKSTRQAQLNKESGDAVLARNRAAQEQNARVSNEQNAAAEAQRTQANADNGVPKENDMVTIDSKGVPQALHTAAMVDSLRGLEAAGMHGRSGRLVRFEEGPAGRMAVIEGADFTQQVPVAAVKRADMFAKEQNPGSKSAAKKSAKKAAKKSSAKKTASKKRASK